MSHKLDADVHPHAHVTIEEDGEWFSMPLDGTRRGSLRVTPGLPPRVTIRGDRALDAFFQTHFTRPTPDIHVADETVTIRYRSRPFGMREWSAQSGSIALNTTIPWAIDIRGGMADMEMNLRDVRLEALAISGGISRVIVTLPEPEGVLPFRITGGVSELVIRRPAGAGARVVVRGGAAGLTLDDSYFAAVGGQMRWDGVGDDGERRIDLTITGGASKVTLERYTPIDPDGQHPRLGS